MNKGSYAAAELLFPMPAKKQRRYRFASKRVYVNPVPAESQSDKREEGRERERERERERDMLNSRESLGIGRMEIYDSLTGFNLA
jgi:hypothetical protein